MADNVKFYDDPDIPNVIELNGISQTYDGGKTMILEDLSLLIENHPHKNQFISVLGPSGCGKSTLLRYISGLQKPTTGEVKLFGQNPPSDEVVGMVFQKYSSFPWLSVLENVALGLKLHGVSEKERNERAMDMIKKVGLDGHQNKYAQYPTLSGGQLQRVAIARSLLASPKILLMDEPFGALDIHTRFEMQELLVKVLEKIPDMTTIFITHDINEAVYLTDEIHIMQAGPGRIVERIMTDLPDRRYAALKRENKFLKWVYEIEDKMTIQAAKAIKTKKKKEATVEEVVPEAIETNKEEVEESYV